MIKHIVTLYLLFVFNIALGALPKECQNIDPYFKDAYRKLAQEKVDTRTKLLMIGSSSVQYWKNPHRYLKKMTKDEVLNRGIGGTRVCHLIVYADQILKNIQNLKHLERVIIYSGDNDLGYNYSAKIIQEHYKYLIDLYRNKGLKAPIYIISTKPSPRRLLYSKRIRKLGELLKLNLDGYKKTYVLDRFKFYFDNNGVIKSELYQVDGLHLKPRVYWDWSWHLEKMWTSSS